MNYKEATEMLGVTVSTIYRWINAGKLEAKKDSNDEWVISRESAEEVLQEEQSKLKKHAKSVTLYSTDLELNDYINKQVSNELKVIKSFASDIVEAKEESFTIEAIEKVISRYENINKLQAGADVFKKFRQQKKHQIILEKEGED